jgi:hypothetical protein
VLEPDSGDANEQIARATSDPPFRAEIARMTSHVDGHRPAHRAIRAISGQ